MDRESNYFTLSLESLRVLGGWAADCAERALWMITRQRNSTLSRRRPSAPAQRSRAYSPTYPE